ncbi:MAG TPA: pteridine reductase [Steroidobacteraceae bacterium]|nr:pteridine reductase [Steroidobacteraceae bacterium]
MPNDPTPQPAHEAFPPDTRLKGKTALITGAARRVGAAIARTLHGAGANLVLHYRSSGEDAAELARELNDARAGSAALVSGDLLDVEKLPALATAAAQAFGGLDILVNNASSFYPTPIGDITLLDWDDLIGTNLKAPLFLTQAAAPALHANQGLVLNLCDIHGLRPLRRHPVYSVAKAGLIMLTKSLARELGPHVRVNAIAPGPVLWPDDGLDKALQAEIIDRTALKRPGSAQDVARAALFFAAEAPYVTGQILAVDGGRSVGW